MERHSVDEKRAFEMLRGESRRSSRKMIAAEQVAAPRDKARRKREDDWSTGKAKPARLGESIRPV
jgi:hypothetical protein